MVTAADKQKAAKVPVWQGVFAYFSNALQAVGAISKFGAAKHNEGNMPTHWRNYSTEVYADALARHITEEGKGDLYDSESGMLHAGHEAWNALARLEKLLEKYPLMRPITATCGDGGLNPAYKRPQDPTPSTPHTKECQCYDCKPYTVPFNGINCK